MSIPLISVLMPCRNCAATLPEAMNSLLAQSLKEIEVVAVDDGSQDGTRDLLQGFARRDRRVRVLSRPYQGITAALNQGLEVSRADLVARMDADDVACSSRLASQVRFLEDNPEIGLVGSRVSVDEHPDRSRGFASFARWSNSVLTSHEISIHRFVENPLIHPTIVFRKVWAARAGAYRQGMFPEDYELVLRWLEHGVVMAKLGSALVDWRDRPDRLSRTDPRCSVEAFYRMKSPYLARWLKANNPWHPRVAVLGAGRKSAPRAMLLEGHGVRIEAFFDLDPARVGKSRYGRPVRDLIDLPDSGQTFCLSYAGVRGAREKIAAFLRGRGYVLGRDALLAA